MARPKSRRRKRAPRTTDFPQNKSLQERCEAGDLLAALSALELLAQFRAVPEWLLDALIPSVQAAMKGRPVNLTRSQWALVEREEEDLERFIACAYERAVDLVEQAFGAEAAERSDAAVHRAVGGASPRAIANSYQRVMRRLEESERIRVVARARSRAYLR